MANLARPSGFLPSIKCSNCNVEVPISMMGDHVCSQVPTLPSSRFNALDGPFAPAALKETMGAPLSRPQKAIPPRLNAASTFDSFLRLGKHSKSTAEITAQTASPVTHSSRPKSPFRVPFLRSSTSPLPSRPVSPVLPTSQDSAFPPFPMARSPTTPLDSSFNFSTNGGSSQEWADKVAGRAAVSPQASVGGDLMQRMDSIVPGPFSFGDDMHQKPSGHSKSPSMGSSRDFVRISRSMSPKTHRQRPSTSSSNYTRNPSLSSISAGPRSMLDQSKTEVPTMPSVPRPSFQDQSDGSAHVPLPSFDFGSFRREPHAHVSPIKHRDAASAASLESRPPVDRIPSGSSTYSHKPKPSVAVAAMQPLYDIGSTSSFKPSRSVRSRAASPAIGKTSTALSVNIHAAAQRDDQRLRDAPPVPVPTHTAEVFKRDDAYHQPHESTSSNESYSSGVKSGSSVSTPHESTSSNESYSFAINGDTSRASPPLNGFQKGGNAHASGDNQASDMFKSFIFDVEQPALEEPASRGIERTTDYPQPSTIKAPAPIRTTNPTFPRHGEALIQNHSPATSPDDYMVPSFASQLNHLRVSPAPAAQFRYPESTARRPSPASKGSCRGCGDLIRGKSVSSADGRLTGRYHKQCFVCHTCRQPFQTAEFYVMNNQPYCARHYHELNDSLCTSCDRGIEGQYLETEAKQKFHPYCFGCQECHIILKDDYYEFNGRTLCEQHAFGAARTSTPSSLGPGRRFPERRTTRLMMM